jgi:hypothetical protein
MKNRKIKHWYLYYKETDTKETYIFYRVYCKLPNLTTHYKKMKNWLEIGRVEKIGYCDQLYFEDYSYEFKNSKFYLTPNNL